MIMHGHLHHIEIYVSDLQRSLDFWEWLLVGEFGYESYQRWENGASFKLAETYLVFVQAEGDFLEIPYHRKRPGLNHLAFHADSRDMVDELTTKLRARGVIILYEKRHPHTGGESHYAVYFEDPDRIKVEIIAPD